jgi:Ceramidase
MSLIVSYCERTGTGLWAEPLNAFTNLAFVVAALALIPMLRRITAGRSVPVSLQLLLALLVVIGIGSFVFHTVSGATLVLDVIPIAVFVLCYAAIVTHLFFGVPWRLAWLGSVAVAVLVVVLGVALAALGFTDTGRYYVPVLLATLGLGVAISFSADATLRRHGPRLAGIGLLFAAALAFRQLDLPLCSSFPLGTHWIWHLLDAAVLFLGTWLAAVRWRETAGPAATAVAAG